MTKIFDHYCSLKILSNYNMTLTRFRIEWISCHFDQKVRTCVRLFTPDFLFPGPNPNPYCNTVNHTLTHTLAHALTLTHTLTHTITHTLTHTQTLVVYVTPLTHTFENSNYFFGSLTGRSI